MNRCATQNQFRIACRLILSQRKWRKVLNADCWIRMSRKAREMDTRAKGAKRIPCGSWEAAESAGVLRLRGAALRLLRFAQDDRIGEGDGVRGQECPRYTFIRPSKYWNARVAANKRRNKIRNLSHPPGGLHLRG